MYRKLTRFIYFKKIKKEINLKIISSITKFRNLTSVNEDEVNLKLSTLQKEEVYNKTCYLYIWSLLINNGNLSCKS